MYAYFSCMTSLVIHNYALIGQIRRLISREIGYEDWHVPPGHITCTSVTHGSGNQAATMTKIEQEILPRLMPFT